MANTYTQLYVHFVFAIKGKTNFIPSKHNEELHKYIAGIIRNRECKCISINNMPDHLHILASLCAKISPSKLMQDVKSNSSKLVILIQN